MIVLALDTSGKEGSVALARGSVVRERAGAMAPSHAARLPGALMAMLEETGVALADVDVFAVTVGPGSFTGVRVGIAAMQGLAFAGSKPLIGVSALDALAVLARAQQPDDSSLAATWIDAWRGEVYAALYRGHHQIEPPRVESAARLLDRLPAAGLLFVGDGVAGHEPLIRERHDGARFAAPLSPMLAGTVATLAIAAAERGERPLPGDIRALYVRRPDVERVKDARLVR